MLLLQILIKSSGSKVSLWNVAMMYYYTLIMVIEKIIPSPGVLEVPPALPFCWHCLLNHLSPPAQDWMS